MSFEYAVKHTLENEGVFVNHPKDPGGKTKYGVTERYWIPWWKNEFPNQPVVPIESITKTHAIAFYKDVFWDFLQLDRIGDQYVAAEIFDSAVNVGADDAVKFLQGAINYLRHPHWDKIKVDGILGPITRNKTKELIRQGYRIALLEAMNGEQYQHYKAIGNQHMSRGWTRRLQLAKELA